MSKKYKLTAAYRALLDKHRDSYVELATGERRATTKAQRRFVRVAKRFAIPSTDHEWAFVKWQVARDREHREEDHARSPGYQEFGDQLPRGDWFADDQLGRLGPYRKGRKS